MPTTPRGYPYPVSSDSPAGMTQIQSLATAIDTDVGGINTRLTVREKPILGITRGSTNIGFGGETIIDSVTWVHTLNHYERVSFSSSFSLNTGGVMILRYRFVTGSGPVLTSSTLLYEMLPTGSGANNQFAAHRILPESFRTSATGTYTIAVSATAASGAASGTMNGAGAGIARDFVVEDCGIPQ